MEELILAREWDKSFPKSGQAGHRKVTFHNRYCKTPRGYHPRSLNSNGGWSKIGCMSFLNQPILCCADEIRGAVRVMHGEKDKIILTFNGQPCRITLGGGLCPAVGGRPVDRVHP